MRGDVLIGVNLSAERLPPKEPGASRPPENPAEPRGGETPIGVRLAKFSGLKGQQNKAQGGCVPVFAA